MDLEHLKNNPEQIKLLIDVLSSLLPSQEVVDTTTTKSRKKTKKSQPKLPESESKIRTARGKTRGSGVNKFDAMPERNSHKEDTLIDKKLSKFPPTERSRHFEYVTLQCRCCGKKEKVNPGLVIEKDRYKCNKCSISAG
jgi:hypothetical protein